MQISSPPQEAPRRAASCVASRVRLVVALGGLLLLLSAVFMYKAELLLESPGAEGASLTRVATALTAEDASAATEVSTDEALATEYDCVGWKQTGGCAPDGPREPQHDGRCTAKITGGRSGYCVYHHKTIANRIVKVMPMHCDSLSNKIGFRCMDASNLVTYGAKTLAYVHDAAFSIDAIQADVRASLPPTHQQNSFTRGISMVIFEKVLPSAFASIRMLRELGCTLPVEIWFKRDETDPNHPLLLELTANYSVFVREIKNPLATKYYTKLHAVYYSAFDSVLLLDADNFAVRDPTFLFDTSAFSTTGAIFWPDFWHPDNTIFGIQKNSVLWTVFDITYVDMFEQESGQVLIDRRRHVAALNALMYYGFSLPRVHETLNLVWGDKDLFRLAWMKTNSSFHMIERPPATAGKLNAMTNKFCGMTMAQHDAQGELLFLHRNMEKLRVETKPNKKIWTHIMEFKRESPRSKYIMGWAKVFPDILSCWGKASGYSDDYVVTPIEQFPFRDEESRLLALVDEAAAIMQRGGVKLKIEK